MGIQRVFNPHWYTLDRTNWDIIGGPKISGGDQNVSNLKLTLGLGHAIGECTCEASGGSHIRILFVSHLSDVQIAENDNL